MMAPNGLLDSPDRLEVPDGPTQKTAKERIVAPIPGAGKPRRTRPGAGPRLPGLVTADGPSRREHRSGIDCAVSAGLDPA